MSSSLLLQEWPACFVNLDRTFCATGGKWPYSSCFVECCFWDLFKTLYSFIVLSPPCFSLDVSLKTNWCNHTVVLTRLLLGRIPVHRNHINLWVKNYALLSTVLGSNEMTFLVKDLIHYRLIFYGSLFCVCPLFYCGKSSCCNASYACAQYYGLFWLLQEVLHISLVAMCLWLPQWFNCCRFMHICTLLFRHLSLFFWRINVPFLSFLMGFLPEEGQWMDLLKRWVNGTKNENNCLNK